MSVFKSSSDESLIEQSLAGEDRAFAELVNRYAPIVMAWLSANNENRGENEDLTQDAFLSAYSQLSRLRNRQRFGPWLVRIARNRLADSRRKKQREVPTTDLEPDALGNPEDAAGIRHTATPGPREHASSMETKSVVIEAVGKMNDTYREILYMRLIDEETPQMIAHRLGLKESTVRMRLLRGLKKLGKSIRIE